MQPCTSGSVRSLPIFLSSQAAATISGRNLVGRITPVFGMDSDSDNNPIEAFFDRYPSFPYRPSSDWRQLSPFYALAKHCQWSNERRKKELKRFKHTWTDVVESEFDGSSLSHYQSL
jgi:hypothetical protein